MRSSLALLTVLAASCTIQRSLPVRYDLDETAEHSRVGGRLNATIAVSPIQAPSWLRTTALVYRLDYEAPVRPGVYGQSQWTAPPGELLTLRLRERIAAVNDGFTLTRLPETADGYHLDVTLENFTQVFAAADRSECVVTLSATLVEHRGRVVAQRTFSAEHSAPSADAAGAVEGLVSASDSDLEQIVTWLLATLPVREAAAAQREDPFANLP
jgi:cholesterol transport system auxiliary component